MSEERENWLPNLVGGVSIWKLAPDLNQERFFDGRLLVPETEGSESLPVKVNWDLTGLTPLAEARASDPSGVDKAIQDFLAALKRVGKVMSEGGSGFDKYREAFTMPALDADGGANYFYDAKSKKLHVINWGASPRRIKLKKQYLFGYQDFGTLIERAQQGAAVAAVAGAAAAGSAAAASADATPEEKPGEKPGETKDEEAKDDQAPDRTWLWIALAVVLLVLAVILAVALKDCGKEVAAGPDGSVAGADGSVPDGGDGFIYGHAIDDGGIAATVLHDGGLEAGTATSDAGPDAMIASQDAGPDAAASSRDGGRRRDGGGNGNGSGSGSGNGSGNGSGSGSGSGAGRPPRDSQGRIVYGRHRDPGGNIVYWIEGDQGAPVALPHREHYHPEAMQWRIVGGTDRVYDFDGTGPNFHVYLYPNENFDGVLVQWRDRSGSWHDH